jgi:hypothetical protein
VSAWCRVCVSAWCRVCVYASTPMCSYVLVCAYESPRRRIVASQHSRSIVASFPCRRGALSSHCRMSHVAWSHAQVFADARMWTCAHALMRIVADARMRMCTYVRLSICTYYVHIYTRAHIGRPCVRLRKHVLVGTLRATCACVCICVCICIC